MANTLPPGAKIAVRCAIRLEGQMVNAYIAQPDTMAGALLIGSIIPCVKSVDKSLYEDWIVSMTMLMNRIIKRSTGVEVIGNAFVPAPEHERGGQA